MTVAVASALNELWGMSTLATLEVRCRDAVDARALADALRVNSSLRSLVVTGDIQDTGCVAFSLALECNRSITSLTMRSNSLTDRSTVALKEMLRSNTSLVDCDISIGGWPNKEVTEALDRNLGLRDFWHNLSLVAMHSESRSFRATMDAIPSFRRAIFDYVLPQCCTLVQTVKALKDIGFTAVDLTDAGVAARALSEAEYSLSALQWCCTDSELLRLNFSGAALELARMRNETSANPIFLVKEAGYKLADLKAAGYTPYDMWLAWFSHPDVPSLADLLGCSAESLAEASYYTRDVLEAGSNAMPRLLGIINADENRLFTFNELRETKPRIFFFWYSLSMWFKEMAGDPSQWRMLADIFHFATGFRSPQCSIKLLICDPRHYAPFASRYEGPYPFVPYPLWDDRCPDDPRAADVLRLRNGGTPLGEKIEYYDIEQTEYVAYQYVVDIGKLGQAWMDINADEVTRTRQDHMWPFLSHTQCCKLPAECATDDKVAACPRNGECVDSQSSELVQIAGHAGTVTRLKDAHGWVVKKAKETETKFYESAALEGVLCGRALCAYRGCSEDGGLMLEDVVNAALQPSIATQLSHGAPVGFNADEDHVSGGRHPVRLVDVKVGFRTFLSSELDLTPRADLFAKMLEADPTSPTKSEVVRGKITKGRYMMFREGLSSTLSVGFRVEGYCVIADSGSTLADTIADKKALKKTRTEKEVHDLLCRALPDATARAMLARQLESMVSVSQESQLFMSHRVVGASVLMAAAVGKPTVAARLVDFEHAVAAEGVTHVYPASEAVSNNDYEEDGIFTALSNLAMLLEYSSLGGELRD